MYKAGDLVIVVSFRNYVTDKKSYIPVCDEQEDYKNKVAYITRVTNNIYGPWDYIIDNKFLVMEDQIVPAKIVEQDVYKALTEVDNV